jgi:hypothetical protein
MNLVTDKMKDRESRLMAVIESAAERRDLTPSNADLSVLSSGGGGDAIRSTLKRLVERGLLTIETHKKGGAIRRFVLPDGRATEWGIIKIHKPICTVKKRKSRPKTNSELAAIISEKDPTRDVWLNARGLIESAPKDKAVR